MDNLIHFKFLYRTAALLVRIDFNDVDGRAERMTIVGIGGGATLDERTTHGEDADTVAKMQALDDEMMLP